MRTYWHLSCVTAVELLLLCGCVNALFTPSNVRYVARSNSAAEEPNATSTSSSTGTSASAGAGSTQRSSGFYFARGGSRASWGSSSVAKAPMKSPTARKAVTLKGGRGRGGGRGRKAAAAAAGAAAAGAAAAGAGTAAAETGTAGTAGAGAAGAVARAAKVPLTSPAARTALSFRGGAAAAAGTAGTAAGTAETPTTSSAARKVLSLHRGGGGGGGGGGAAVAGAAGETSGATREAGGAEGEADGGDGGEQQPCDDVLLEEDGEVDPAAGCGKGDGSDEKVEGLSSELAKELVAVRAGGSRGGGSRGAVAAAADKRVSASWPMFSAFLYFLAMSFTIPVLPKVVNEMLTGSKAVTAASATLYGLLSSTDATFTLLSVNFHATMSDKYGRRPFLALSALGLGIGFCMTYHSTKVWMLLLAAAIDGSTSCMYSIAQACITDCVGTGPKLGEAFGLFQGVSLGMAFMIGLPLGGVLGAKYGVRFPLLVSMSLCALNVLLVTFIMPETLQEERRKPKVDLKQANPLGAVKMASRNNLITGVIACWTLLWISHVGLQINWINYTDRKFEWGVAQSGASLALMGLLVAVFPKLIIPRLGLERSITYGLLVYALSQLLIAAAPGVSTARGHLGTPVVLLGLILASAGTVAFPSTLAFLSNQVGGEELGALQGTTDTAKTVCSVLFGPAMAWIFGYFISDNAFPRQIEGASYYVGMVVALCAWATARRTFSEHGHLDKVPPSERTAPVAVSAVDEGKK